MNLDQTLIAIAIASYIMGTLALSTYFLARTQLAKQIGVPFAFLGCGVQLAELTVRYQTTHIWPLTNLYGSLSLFAALSVLIFLLFSLKYDLWFLGGFVQAIAAIFLAYALTWNEGYLPAVPALQSYWIKIHVPVIIGAYAAFMVSFVTASLYLVRYYLERSVEARRGVVRMNPAVAAGPGNLKAAVSMQTASPGIGLGELRTSAAAREGASIAAAAEAGDSLARWLQTLPALSKLDIMTYRIIAVGLPLLTVGIITGAWWAKEAWGAYWQWDPKETASLFCWIWYAAYMHLHTRNQWRGLRCAWLGAFGFVAVLFCYLGVNIWVSGLHSYKM
jgi:cytochrome c-type biogenesis protein CcsB